MKQRIKKQNNRKKADFGLTAALIGLAGSLAAAGINSATQRNLAEKQRRQQLLMDNEVNALQAAANQSQALNYDNQQELESLKTGYINSLNSQSSQFKYGGDKPKPRRHRHYTDPYAQEWYKASLHPGDGRGYPIFPGETVAEIRNADLQAADYIESMYRYHLRKYLAERNNRENNHDFIGPPSPKGYIPNTIKEGMQFKNYDASIYGPYNDDYPDLPSDYNKYKCGGKRRMKKNGGTVISNLNKLNIYI